MYPNNVYGTSTFSPYNPPQIPMPPQKTKVDRVTGRNGAELYQMAPDSQVILLDENEPMIWFISTDSAGYKTIAPYDIAPHQEKKMPDIASIDDRLNHLDKRLTEIEEALK